MAIYTNEMLESMKKVEAARAVNVTLDPRRMTAEEKDTLLMKIWSFPSCQYPSS